MLRSLTIAALFAASAAPALAAPAPTVITQDGYTFSYTTSLDRHGLVQIRGELLDTGQPIDLVVNKSGYVSGSIGRSNVDFKVPQTTRDSLAESLAPHAPQLASSK